MATSAAKTQAFVAPDRSEAIAFLVMTAVFVIAPMFARVSGPERKMPSGTSGSLLRRSIITKVMRRAATIPNEPTVRADPQPAC